MEKVLRVQPNVKKLYLLIRAEDDKSAKLRFQNEVRFRKVKSIKLAYVVRLRVQILSYTRISRRARGQLMITGRAFSTVFDLTTKTSQTFISVLDRFTEH